jgi:predicted nucleic acid-binding protein
VTVAVLADTSGLYALLDRDDGHHKRAAAAWRDLLAFDRRVIAHSFVLLEVWSLVQARLGFEALDVLQRDFLPLLEVHPIAEGLLEKAMARCMAGRRRDLSLTDCVSLEFMHEKAVRSAFAFDRHFLEEGFLLPGGPTWPAE